MSLKAELRLPNVFSDHMVLQRGTSIPVFGRASPGERVTVELAGVSAHTDADATGTWRVNLAGVQGVGPFELVVRAGQSAVTYRDVLVGEVWLCSGQSNMEWPVRLSNNPDEEIAGAVRPRIRLLSVPRISTAEPRSDQPATWQVCSPETVADFSAVGYFFGRSLIEALDVPIGLIDSSWGGTPAEAWTPLPAMKAMTDLPTVMQVVDATSSASVDQAKADYQSRFQAWLKATGRDHAPNDPAAASWGDVGFDDSGWSSLDVPGAWQTQGQAFNARAWYRRTIELPASVEGMPGRIELGAVDDFDRTYVNGQLVGSIGPEHETPWTALRVYDIPAGLLRPGANVIAVRVFDHGGNGGLMGPADAMKLTVGDQTIDLTGSWKWNVESRFVPAGNAAMPAQPAIPGSGNYPAGLYNAMIHPLAPYALRGTIWYQGESNAGRHQDYAGLLSGMIESWRSTFEKPEMSFYIVQLANFMVRGDDPNESNTWPELRESQVEVTRRLSRTGVALAIDIGEEMDIHPRNKQEVGRRLARIALAQDYGKPVPFAGPTFRSATLDAGRVVVAFDHADGLEARGELDQSFALAGADGRYVWAEAELDGSSVVLEIPAGMTPTQVRYAWLNNPTAPLYNDAGLPGVPFERSID
jgi:sialate O-acetylesterase